MNLKWFICHAWIVFLLPLNIPCIIVYVIVMYCQDCQRFFDFPPNFYFLYHSPITGGVVKGGLVSAAHISLCVLDFLFIVNKTVSHMGY